MTGLKKEIAKTLNLPVIALCQTNRDTREADSEVGTRSGKGGTAIEATSDFSIGLRQNKDDIVGRFLKHRRFNAYSFGRNPYFQLDIDLPTLTVKDMKHRSKPENMDY
jgi:hypothetical protein